MASVRLRRCVRVSVREREHSIKATLGKCDQYIERVLSYQHAFTFFKQATKQLQETFKDLTST